MIIPVRFHILAVLLIFHLQIGIGQSASSAEVDCQNRVRIINESSCQQSVYVKSFDEVVTESFVGLLQPGEERFVDTKSSSVFVYAVNDLNQQVAGALSMNCENNDLAIASCFVDQNDDSVEVCEQIGVNMLKNGAKSSVVSEQLIASCGERLELEVADAVGVAVWTMPNQKSVITKDVHLVSVAESIDEYFSGTYLLDWYDVTGCHSLFTYQLNVANCCALRNTMIADTVLCEGDSIWLAPKISDSNICTEFLSGYVSRLFDTNGNVEDLDRYEGPKDSYGPSLYRQATNEATYIILELDELVPAESEICLTIRQGSCSDSPFNSSNFMISAGNQVFALDDRFEYRDEKLSNSFQDYCFTVKQATRYVKLEDLGNGCGIRFDAASWSKQISFENFQFIWNDGSNGKAMLAQSPGLYSLQVIDCNGCSTYNEVIVSMKDCTVETDPDPEPCEESYSIPSAISDSFRGCYGDTRIDGNVSTNDNDLDGFDLEYDLLQSPANGLVTLRDDGVFFYYPNEGFSGEDNFFYSLCKKEFTPCDDENLKYKCATGFVTMMVHAPSIDLGAASAVICDDENFILSVPESMNAEWSTGQAGNSIALNSSGIYAVSVTDQFGCVATDAITLEVNERPTVQLSKSNDLNCDFNSSVISAIGTEGAEYRWNTGQTGERISVDRPGDYVVTVTNGTGCSSVSQISVEEQIINVTAVISGSRSICSESDRSVLSAFGGDSYVWSTGQTGQSIEVVGSGTYSVTAINDATGCRSESSISIGLIDNYANAGEDIRTCAGSSVVIGTNQVGPDNAVFLWSNGASGRIGPNATGEIVVVASQTQTYTVRVTVNNCIVEDQVTVFVNDFNFNTSGNSSICPGASTVLSAFGADRYQWNTGEVTADIVVAPTETTSYSVIGFDDNGCQSEQVMTVFVEGEMQTSISADQTLCPGASTTISATGGNVYQWSNGALGSAITVRPTESTNYTVTITNAAGCQKTESVNVLVESIPAFNLGDDKVVCRNTTQQLNAPQAESYLWSTGETTQSIQVIASGRNSYSVTITQGQCTATDDIIIDGVDCLGDISGSSLTNEGEPLVNVTISLFQNGETLQVVEPNENGFYRFEGLAPGQYIVQQSDIAGYSNFSDEDESPDDDNDVDEANNRINVRLESNESDEDNNFRDLKNFGVIAGYSLVDLDDDGIGDRGFAGVNILLLDEADAIIQIASVNDNARYKFEGLSPGEYTVQQSFVEGFSSIYDSDATTDAQDRDGLDDPVDNRIPVLLTLNENDIGNNFIVRQTTESKISGFVMLDTNRDGAGDTPQADVSVDLYQNRERQARTKTDDNGYYEFVDVDEGQYFVLEDDDDQNEYESLYDRDDSVTSFDTDGFDTVVDNAIEVILVSGEHDAHNNFVNFIPTVGTISGSVFEDVTGNPEDYIGIEGISISLYTLNDQLVASVTTNINGAYIFNDIPTGDYKLFENDVLGFEDVSDYDRIDPDDPNDVDETNDVIYVSIEADEIDSGNDFVDRRIEGAIVETCTVVQVDDFTTGSSDYWLLGGDDAIFDTQIPTPQGLSSAVVLTNDNIGSLIDSRPLNYTGVNSLMVKLNFLVRGADVNQDYFAFEVSNGGGPFVELRRWSAEVDFTNGTWVFTNVVVPKENLSSETVLRIRSYLSSAAEDVYLDDIAIELCFDENEDNGSGTAFTGDQANNNFLVQLEKQSQLTDNETPGVYMENTIGTESDDHNNMASSIYPNPTSDYLTVDLRENLDQQTETTIEVYSLDGQLQFLKRTKDISKIKLDLKDIESEQLYILYIRQENKIPEMFRFLKIN